MRPKLTYANVIATLALFLALGGGAAFAASQLGKNSVGTKQLKRNAVTAAKVKDRSLLAKDFKAGQLPAGPQGAPGVTSVVVRYGADGKPKEGEDDESFARCLPGETVVGGGYDSPEGEGAENFEYAVVADRPSLEVESEGNETWPVPANGAAATGWLVAMDNETSSTFYFTAYVLCARP